MKVFNEPRKKLLNSNALTQTLKTTGKTSIYWNNQTKLCIWTRRILTPTDIPIKDASTRPISGAFLFSHLKASGQTPDKTEGKEAPKLRKEIPPQFSFFLFVVFGRRIRRHLSSFLDWSRGNSYPEMATKILERELRAIPADGQGSPFFTLLGLVLPSYSVTYIFKERNRENKHGLRFRNA